MFERVREREAVGGGYTLAKCHRVVLEGGQRAFVKRAADDFTARCLARERDVYTQLAGEPFLARMLAWQPAAQAPGGWPALMLEDLGAGHWPPPWSRAQLERLFEALDEVAATPPPPCAPRLTSRIRGPLGWERVAEDAEAFLGLELASEGWLQGALEGLLEAQQSASLDGDELLHFDLSSGNTCFLPDRVVLVDWAWAARGDARCDRARFLPQICAQTGHVPEDFMPWAPEYAALVSGTLAARAGLAPIPEAPGVRAMQRRQLEVALPWAQRALGLAPLDGPQSRSM